jgi:caa(3)-type oxidase, subunit IV
MADYQHTSEHAAHHVTPLSTYYAIFAALIVLTALTTGIAFIDLGPLNTPVALAIAIAKATLVVLYFMHVRHSPKLTMVIIIASILWLGVLFALTLADYLSRPWSTM